MEDRFLIYTDGSCNNIKEPKYGGWAYLIIEKGTILEQKSGNDIHTTNNRMEMTAIINSLQNIPANSKVNFFTDSRYSIGAFERTYIAPTTKNVDLINMFNSIVYDKNLDVTFTWVKGHNGDKYNEIVDNLANGEYEKASGEKIPDFRKIKQDKIRKFAEIDKELMGIVSVIRFDTRPLNEQYLKDRVEEIKRIVYFKK